MCNALSRDFLTFTLPNILFFKLEIKERKNNLLVCEAYKAKLFLNVEGQNYPPTYEVRSWCLTELKFELDY